MELGVTGLITDRPDICRLTLQGADTRMLLPEFAPGLLDVEDVDSDADDA